LILEMVREAKEHEEDVVESVAGAWGYDVDSVEFVRELRRTERVYETFHRHFSFHRLR